MKRLALIIVVALLMMFSARVQGIPSYNSSVSTKIDSFQMTINGDLATLQFDYTSGDTTYYTVAETITVLDTIEVSCNIVASASISGAPYNQAQLQGSLQTPWYGDVPGGGTADITEGGYVSSISKTYTLNSMGTGKVNIAGTYAWRVNSNAYAKYKIHIDDPYWSWDAVDEEMIVVTFVVVDSPSELIGNLIDQIQEIDLQQGIEQSLDAKLNAALNTLDDLNTNNDVAAVNTLYVFIDAVEAQRGDKLTNEQADQLTGDAQAIINLI